MPHLKRLIVTNVRNLQSVNIQLSPSINLFCGDNGSGKTSLLESIALLGMGRSFRSHKTRSLVNHQQNELTVFAELLMTDDRSDVESSIPLGIQKTKSGTTQIKLNGEVIQSAAILAKQLPFLVINAASFQLVEGSPLQRRQFLDWMVFHVKPDFSTLWKNLQKVLKQRNSILRRDKINYSDVRPWDVEFIAITESIDTARKVVFESFVEEMGQLLPELTDESLAIEFEYYRGWDRESPFSVVLEESFERDARDGYTHNGPQRAEVKIRAQKKMAVDVLSRGQEKALVCSMTVAQASLYHKEVGQSCIFLVDDLLAELDERHTKKLTQGLVALGGQVFVTGISSVDLIKSWDQTTITPKLFHVEQGQVLEAS